MFLLVGGLGFVPGITTNSGDLTIAGHHADAMLRGLFQVSVLHKVVHLLVGVAGLLLARSFAGAKATASSSAPSTSHPSPLRRHPERG